MRSALIMAAAIVSGGGASYAGIGVETYGTAAPPNSVNGLAVAPVPFNPAVFADVTEVALWGGKLTFASGPHSVRQIGLGWATWSHGYTGNVYYTNGLTSTTLILSSGVGAFQFYAEPNPFGVFSMTATGSDGSSTTSATQSPDGSSGAMGWGFYGTGGAAVVSVTISSDVDFAVGEFATMPAPGSIAALGLAALVTTRRRR